MNNASSRVLFPVVISVASLIAMTATAIAQEMAVLEEIVVTARKRVELIQDVPMSISTMSADEISTLMANGQDVRFLNGRIPSLRVESSFGRAFPRFYIRGLGNTDFDLNASQPVSLVYDEVVMENPILKGKPIFDLDQIAVARGPQGTLFGRNTPAGVVKFVTKRPTDELDGYAEVSYGTYDTTEVNVAVGGPMSSILNGRISGQYINRNDWIDNQAPGFEEQDALGGYTQWAVRGQLLFETGDDFFSALVTGHAWEINKGTARVFQGNLMNKGGNSLRPGYDPEVVFHDAATRNDQSVDAWGSSLILEFDFGAVELISITGYETLKMYSQADVDGGFGGVDRSPFPPITRLPEGPNGQIHTISETADGIPDLDQITQEFRLASNGEGSFNWLAGVYYFDEDLSIDSFAFDTIGTIQGVGGLDGHATQMQETEAWAVFGSVDWQISDRWTLGAGIRYSDDEKDFVAGRPIPLFQPDASLVTIPVKTSDDFTNWDLSANFAINEDVNLYGRVATGSRGPSIQGRILFVEDFASGMDPATDGVSVADTEDLISGEIGIKSELFDNRLRLNAAVYVFQMDDQQLTRVGGTQNVAELLNVDTTNGYGLEVDVDWVPIDNLTITAGFSYNDTEWDDPTLTSQVCALEEAFADGAFPLPADGPDTLCTVTSPTIPNPDNPIQPLALLDGSSLPQAPEIVFTGAIRYGFQLGGSNELYGTLDWAYQDDARFFLYESAEFEDDFFELGLRVGYTFGDRYEVAVFGRNITDEDNVKGGIDFSNLTGMVADPATWGLVFNAKFGQ